MVEQFCVPHNYLDDSGILRKGSISAKKGEQVVIPANMRDGSILGIGKGNAGKGDEGFRGKQGKSRSYQDQRPRRLCDPGGHRHSELSGKRAGKSFPRHPVSGGGGLSRRERERQLSKWQSHSCLGGRNLERDNDCGRHFAL